jgi:hypothetical protein
LQLKPSHRDRQIGSCGPRLHPLMKQCELEIMTKFLNNKRGSECSKGFDFVAFVVFKEALVVTISRHPCGHGLTRELLLIFLRRTHKAGPPGHERRLMLGGHETRPPGSARGPLNRRTWKPRMRAGSQAQAQPAGLQPQAVATVTGSGTCVL